MLYCTNDGVMKGGKYDGWLVCDIIDKDPKYSMWLKTKANCSDLLHSYLCDL